MAEFQEVMRQWRRMCVTLGVTSCEECRLHTDGNDCVAVYEGEMDYDAIEPVVMAWAKEHPEPVYPTWYEWLKSVDVLTSETVLHQSKPTSTSTQQSYVTLLKGNPKLYKPIPADIAEKLGIEPKEG